MVPELLLLALCQIESSGNPDAINVMDGTSPSYGYCQVKLETAQWMGFDVSAQDLMDKEINKKVARAYLNYQYKRYNDWSLAVAAYNAGRVKRTKDGLINQAYVDKVFNKWHIKAGRIMRNENIRTGKKLASVD